VIIPALGGLASQLSGLGSAGTNAAEGLLAGSAAPAAPGQNAGTLGSSEGAGGEGSGFGGALTQAISSLESTQQSADAASQALATGTVKDPEAAIATVEDAALSMQLAAQIRTKATEATQTIFQTQV
jgi:flagellar hook-basal body complex protein FliE